jgi:hypothetical protein
MSKIQEIKTESPSNDTYGIIPENNVERISGDTFKKKRLATDFDLLKLYLKEEITFSELLILQLLREYYTYTS